LPEALGDWVDTNGAELFTGNVLIVMAWANRRVPTIRLLRNWTIVYAGNLVGALGTAALVILGGWYRIGNGSVGAAALSTASSKVAHTPVEAFFLGILCNILVCLAVWMTYSARSTTDRILATAVNARWRHAGSLIQEPGSAGLEWSGPGWADSYCAVRDLLLAAFADTHSYSLQQTLFAMGQRVLDDRPEIAEIRLSLPNKHHFEVDMSPFGLENAGEVFYAADRPYGLIEGTITRDEAPPPGKAW